MTLKEMPKVGEKVRYVGESQRGVTIGSVYEISGINFGDVTFRDDDDTRRVITALRYSCWELVTEPSEHTPVEASPTVIDLLANLSRRLYEAEQTIKEQAYEINELYREVADRG